jgi:hypothetical protein
LKELQEDEICPSPSMLNIALPQLESIFLPV